MKKLTKITWMVCWLLAAMTGFAQTGAPGKDSINNLVLAPGYTTTEWSAVPAYIKSGTGKQALILVPGMGFDGSVFADFMKANQKKYMMYAITIPGYGNTKAPPMPVTDTSY